MMTHKGKTVLSLLLFILAGCTPTMGTKPPELVIDEYLLVGPPDISTEALAFHFVNGDQKEILACTEAYRDFRSQVADYNSRVLGPFGYALKNYNYGRPGGFFQIFHGDTIFVKNGLYMQPISLNTSKTDFIGIIELDEGTYTFTKDGLEKRIWPPVRELYGYVGDQILSLEFVSFEHQRSLARVYLDDALVYESEIHDISTYGSKDGPWTYNEHWAIVLLDAQKDDSGEWKMVHRVVQDGQDLNTKYGYEQSFQFAVLNGRPFYFFQNDGKIDISFDEQEIAKGYDEIPHYNCCSRALFNPHISMNMIWFFARRGEDWYYVEAYMPMEKSQ